MKIWKSTSCYAFVHIIGKAKLCAKDTVLFKIFGSFSGVHLELCQALHGMAIPAIAMRMCAVKYKCFKMVP